MMLQFRSGVRFDWCSWNNTFIIFYLFWLIGRLLHLIERGSKAPPAEFIDLPYNTGTIILLIVLIAAT